MINIVETDGSSSERKIQLELALPKPETTQEQSSVMMVK